MGVKERQEREREAVARAILDAARDLFVAEGYHNVSIRKVAERIEYSPAAIYSYFPSKDDIFYALAEEGFRILMAPGPQCGQHVDLLDAVRTPFWRMYEFSRTHPEYFALMCVSLVVLTYLSQASMYKSLMMALVGLLLSFVGLDMFTSAPRFTFGINDLTDGVGLIPLVMGLFGVAEILLNLEQSMTRDIYATRLGELLPTARDWVIIAGPGGWVGEADSGTRRSGRGPAFARENSSEAGRAVKERPVRVGTANTAGFRTLGSRMRPDGVCLAAAPAGPRWGRR